jgi:hypothetical protein
MDWNNLTSDDWRDLTAAQQEYLMLDADDIELDVAAAQLFAPGSVATEVTQ